MKCEELLFQVVPLPKTEECVSDDFVTLYLILLKNVFFCIYITFVFSSFFNVIAVCDADIGLLSSVQNSEAACWISRYKTEDSGETTLYMTEQ
jgi:hypothetical protein